MSANKPVIIGSNGTLLEVLLSTADISDILSVGSGEIITTFERATLNSALQPGNNISLLNNNVGYTTVEAAQDAIADALTNTETVQWTYNDAADEITAVATPIFGQGFEQFLSTTIVSYTTPTPFDAYSFTTTSKSPGLYRVALRYSWTPGNTNNRDIFRLRVNGTDLPIFDEREGNDSNSAIRDGSYLLGYFNLVSAGTLNIVLRASQLGGGTSVLHGVVAEVWRVS